MARYFVLTKQVTLDTVEVVLALKDDGSGQHEHGEGLKETVQQAAAGRLFDHACISTLVHVLRVIAIMVLPLALLRANVACCCTRWNAMA